MSSFTVTESPAEPATVLVCAGRLDNNAAGALESAIAPVLARGTKHIVLDLAGVDYLSSAGLRSILVSLKKTNLAGGTLSLCSVSAMVQEVLTLSGFKNILKIHPDRIAALGAIPA